MCEHINFRHLRLAQYFGQLPDFAARNQRAVQIKMQRGNLAAEAQVNSTGTPVKPVSSTNCAFRAHPARDSDLIRPLIPI